jgi:hypothetical protein
MACSCFYNHYWNNKKETDINYKYTNYSFDKLQKRRCSFITEAEPNQLLSTEEIKVGVGSPLMVSNRGLPGMTG